MLEEDALRFDQVRKDNDQKAVQAIKKAEAETKAKAEKVQEIKKLNAQIAQIKAEMSKFEEQLEDCRKYKDFLDSLTPPEGARGGADVWKLGMASMHSLGPPPHVQLHCRQMGNEGRMGLRSAVKLQRVQDGSTMVIMV